MTQAAENQVLEEFTVTFRLVRVKPVYTHNPTKAVAVEVVTMNDKRIRYAEADSVADLGGEEKAIQLLSELLKGEISGEPNRLFANLQEVAPKTYSGAWISYDAEGIWVESFQIELVDEWPEHEDPWTRYLRRDLTHYLSAERALDKVLSRQEEKT